MARYITHFESPVDGATFPADQLLGMHLGRPLLARYDLEAIRRMVRRDDLLHRPAEMWRYQELLPPGDEIPLVTLCENVSPLVECPNLASWLGLGRVSVKDESRLPGCSFKARGLSLALTMARHFGVRRVAMSSNGNAGGAMAIYAARAGLDAVVFVPTDTPKANLMEAAAAGALVYRTDGLIDECGRRIREGHDRGLWFDISTMKEPYRLEGKKTMGFELAEQLEWNLPDVIVYPTGGGTALIAMWKAFEELRELGWLGSDRMPRMIAVQSTGCQPIVEAWQKGADKCERFENARTVAAGLRVPIGIGDFLVLRAVRESHGAAVAADERRIWHWQSDIACREGMMVCPETAACIGAVQSLLEQRAIGAHEHVVIFNTAAGQKYMDHLHLPVPELSLGRLDWDGMEATIRQRDQQMAEAAVSG
jgi:threonine synthase